MSKAPYDERNEADYRAISNKIEIALNLIAADLTIPATEASLAELAGCSRGTLRNRVYPLERLKSLKQLRTKNRRTARISPAHRIAVEVHIDEKKNLREQLNKSRSEVAVWVSKYSDLEREVKKLQRLKDVLLKGNRLLEEQNQKLREFLEEHNSSHQI